MSLNLNNIGRQIKNDKFVAYLKKTIMDLWRCKNDIYPSTVPVLLNREDFDKFEKYEYFITSYLKEKHVQLYFLTDFYNKPMAVLCDKLFNFYRINIECVEEVYLGTLFDCQIKFVEDTYFIYVNDCVCIHGNNIKNMAFEYRLIAVEKFLTSNILFTNHGIILKQKVHYKLNKIGDFIKEITEYNLDASTGLLFLPNKLPLICGMQKSNMVWIKDSQYTVDLTVLDQGESIILECYNLKKKMDYAKVTDKQLIAKIRELDNYSNNCIVEFKIVNKKLEPVMVKLDKLFPNGLRVIENVLYTINQEIKLEEIGIVN